MKLTKAQRETLRNLFGGRCAYCGNELGKTWHADHIEPVFRIWWGKNKGKFERPHNDVLSNFYPACIPCNIHKHAMQLEDWRSYLEEQVDMARRNSAPFRHAERFGLITTSKEPIVFYFEKYGKET
jgi:hypothetical protein